MMNRSLLLFIFLISLSSNGLINSQKSTTATTTTTQSKIVSIYKNSPKSTFKSFTGKQPVNLNLLSNLVSKHNQSSNPVEDRYSIVIANNVSTKNPNSTVFNVSVGVELNEENTENNSTDLNQDDTHVEEKESFLKSLKGLLNIFTSIDRYTIILTVAFIAGVLMISLLIFLSICIWRKLDKGLKPYKSPQQQAIKMKKIKKKPKSKLDFLDEEAAKPDETRPLNDPSDTVKRLSSIKSFSTDSDEDDIDHHRSSPRDQLIGGGGGSGDNKSNASKIPNISSTLNQSIKNGSISNLDRVSGSGGGRETPKKPPSFTKNSRTDLARDEKGVAKASKEKRLSISSNRLPAKSSVSQSSTSINLTPLDTKQLDQEMNDLFGATNNEKIATAAAAAVATTENNKSNQRQQFASSTHDLDKMLNPIDSRANSYSNIYLSEMEKMKKATANKKIKKSNGNLKDISFNPGANGVDKSILSLTESEKSCY